MYFVVATPKKTTWVNTEIKLVGQPILSQLLHLVDKWTFNKLVKEKKSDHYYKAFKSWSHFVTMMFGIFSRCDSMAETCEGLRAMSGVYSGESEPPFR